MRRRAVLTTTLAAGIVGASGCIDEFDAEPAGSADGAGDTGENGDSSDADANDPNPSGDDDTDDEETGDGDGESDGGNAEVDSSSPRYVADPGPVDPESPLVHDVEVVQPLLRTPEAPLTVELSLTNDSDEPLQFGDRRTALGEYLSGNGFRLVPASGDWYHYLDRLDQWVMTDELAITADYQTEVLDPGETATSELAVVLGPTVDVLTESPSELTFDLAFDVGPVDEGIPGADRFEWTFSLVEVGRE